MQDGAQPFGPEMDNGETGGVMCSDVSMQDGNEDAIQEDGNGIDNQDQGRNRNQQMGNNYKNVGFRNQGPRASFNYNKRNQRYNNAYGNYRGGYGPGEGYGPFGPYGHMGPPPPRGPPPMFNRDRNFAARARATRALNYLKSCGVPKDYLKNLPRDLLEQIEPQYCGLCGHELDNESISRMHYLSKNHLKKMKKWVSSKPDTQNIKEVPFKARELYCELCDVHITSKVHAESHYLGRPHRAIVEGRKVPKNPFLLQSGMEVRLAQLIRREKKNLKTMDESTKGKEGQEGPSELPAKDKLAVPPELHCAICDASVTCSEQMTMHLNGKRHLTKEKQHILSMMKGGPPDNSKPKPVLEEEKDNKEDDGGQEEEEDDKPVPIAEADEDSEWPIEGEKWDYM